MEKHTLRSGVFFYRNKLPSENPEKILRFTLTTNHKTGGFGLNLASRNMATKTPMKKKNIAKNVATDVVKPLDSKLTGAQVRDLTQTLVRLKERELARQEKRQTGKHLHDGIIKSLTRSIDLLKNLLQHGYNPGRYVYSEKDFSYSRPGRTLTDAQREKNLANLAKAREVKAKLAAETRTDHD